MIGLVQDVRHAGRLLATTPGFTAVVLLTLMLSIGGNAIIFTGINAVLLRPLPLPEPENVVFVRETVRDIRNMNASAPDFLDWRRDQRVFQHIAASAPLGVALTGRGEAERLSGLRVSADYFRVLGLQPLFGRDFQESDDRFGTARTVLLSETLWRDRFESDRNILGQSLTLDDEPYIIIGVVPASAEFGRTPQIRFAQQIYVPLALTPAELAAPGSHFLTVIARMKSGVTVEQATAEMAGIAKRLQTVRPGSNTGILALTVPVQEALVGDVRRPLLILFAAVAVILLIACVNIANLLLSRSMMRQREIAIRAALGASRSRLIRQALTESLLLAGLGGALAVLLTIWVGGLMLRWLPANVPRLGEATVDGQVLAFTAFSTIVTGLLFGLMPAWYSTRANPQHTLQDTARGTASHHRQRLGSMLVVAELALALILLVGAGLLVRSFARLGAVDLGFEPQGLLALRVSLPQVRYAGPEEVGRFIETATDRLAALPGVTSAAASSHLPLREPGFNLYAQIEDRPLVRENLTMFFNRAVTPDYFRTLGIRVMRGRTFTAEDRADTPRVAVINETAARRYWPNEDPIGQQLKTDDDSPMPATIVGIVSDAKHFSPRAPTEPELFVSHLQTPPPFWRFSRRSFSLVVRSAGNPNALAAPVRAAIRQVDPTIPLFALGSMEEAVVESVDTPRRYMTFVAVFAAIALLLAAIGLYGVMAFNVRQRVREIGVRVALGAARRDVMWLILGRAVAVCLAGVALGVAGAIGASSILASLLFEIHPRDLLTYTVVAGVLMLVGLLASYLPALHATKVDPIVAIRYE
jgi:putative ABC transport system permease protein